MDLSHTPCEGISYGVCVYHQFFGFLLFMPDASDILRRCHARLFLEHPAEVLRILKA